MRNSTPANTRREAPAQPPNARDTAIGRDAPEQRRFWIFTGFVTEGNEPPNACVGVSLWEAGTTVDKGLTAAGTVLRGADPPGGDAVTAGDVAAGAGCGVAGALS